jgi:hypothetical protein
MPMQTAAAAMTRMPMVLLQAAVAVEVAEADAVRQ